MWLVASVIIIYYFLNNDYFILGVFQTSILLIAITLTFLVRYFGIPEGVQTEIHTVTWIITGKYVANNELVCEKINYFIILINIILINHNSNYNLITLN